MVLRTLGSLEFFPLSPGCPLHQHHNIPQLGRLKRRTPPPRQVEAQTDALVLGPVMYWGCSLTKVERALTIDPSWLALPLNVDCQRVSLSKKSGSDRLLAYISNRHIWN
eukprot:1064575-Amphidinium_carterae.1